METARELLARAVRQSHHRVAIASRGKSFTFGELAELSQTLVRKLPATPTPRVAIALTDANAAAAVIASLLAGAIPLVVDPNVPGWRNRVLGNFDPHVTLTNSTEMRAEATQRTGWTVSSDTARTHSQSPYDALYAVATSGTTGSPRIVESSDAGMSRFLSFLVEELGLGPEDVWAEFLPLTSDLGMVNLLSALTAGSLLYVVGSFERALPAVTIRRTGATHARIVPYGAELMLRAGHLDREHLGSLRWLGFGGSPLLWQHVSDLPPIPCWNTYGMTETSGIVSKFAFVGGDPDLPVTGGVVTVGETTPLWKAELRHSPTDGSELMFTAGDLASSMRQGGGVQPLTLPFLSGDRATFDEQGRLFVLGRAGRDVLVNGKRVDLNLIEMAVATRFGISARCVAVAGGYDLVVEAPAPAANTADIAAYLAREIPRSDLPRQVLAAPLVRTATGKVRLAPPEDTGVS